MTVPFLEIRGLSKSFGPVRAVDGVSLSLERGSVLALLGPSGCGKTTTLRLLAGFEEADEGRILIDGQDVTRLAPVARRFGMVFQNYALFPHLDAGENVAFGLQTRGSLTRSEIDRRVTEALALVDLGGFARRRIGELSGGQQQRVALARALAPEPRVLLLDEPLSNLDPAQRERTRVELCQLVRRIGITTVLVTHEQEEAFDLGDRIAVLREGRLEQEGSPDSLYNRPGNTFVARFVGRANELFGRLVSRGENGILIRVEGIEWLLSDTAHSAGDCISPGSDVVLSIRPEALSFAGAGKANVLSGEVLTRRFRGARTLFTIRTAAGSTVEIEGSHSTASPGESVAIVPSGGPGIHVFPGAGRSKEPG